MENGRRGEKPRRSFLPEHAGADTGAYEESLRVLQMGEEGLHEVAFPHGDDHDGWPRARLLEFDEVIELRPVAGQRFPCAVVPREGPGVLRGKGDCDEGLLRIRG